MSRYLPFILLYLCGVLLSSASQILLKKEAQQEHRSVLYEYLNPRVIIGYGIIFGCTLITISAYRGGLPVSYGNVLESTGYLFVLIFGRIFLKERISRESAAALAVILLGVFLFALG